MPRCEEGLPVDAALLVVAVDAVQVGDRYAPYDADAGEDRRDDVLAEEQQGGDSARGAATIAPPSASRPLGVAHADKRRARMPCADVALARSHPRKRRPIRPAQRNGCGLLAPNRCRAASTAGRALPQSGGSTATAKPLPNSSARTATTAVHIPTVSMSCACRCPEAASETPAPAPTPSAFAT